eukprot:CAMPEP_0172616534 /NCGR_PEP_ID=MMETSP1068-20121228/65246_1 /TAXON_ID=35684 /ORGANISM="Pseudopedinella elastica, Strain CCMP716" /LENGTH=218 /DNA_ID=CAMNT_0013421997 /DNA_START=76 /DNA_END=732 /DNA_ORIENTATION=+
MTAKITIILGSLLSVSEAWQPQVGGTLGRMGRGQSSVSNAETTGLNRKDFLGLGVAFLSVGVTEPARAASGIMSQPELYGKAAYGSLEKIEEYVRAVNGCRRVIRSDDSSSRQKKKEVERVISRAVEPMLDAMLLNELSLDLEDDDLKKGAALPQEMKGHLTEIRFFLNEESGFDTYSSSSTGKSYAGGKVERELEEIAETATEYLVLARKGFAEDEF